MSRHVHLPPLMPYLGSQRLEKKEKLRRKAAIKADQTERTAESPTEAVDQPPAPPPSHSPGLLSGAGGALSVLIDAQEAAQPADALARRPTIDDEI